MDQSFSERSNGVVEEELLPLPEDTLARNLGLDLIVVVAKVTMKYSFFTILRNRYWTLIGHGGLVLTFVYSYFLKVRF